MSSELLPKAIESLEYAVDIYGDEDGPWPHIGQALDYLRQHQQNAAGFTPASVPSDKERALKWLDKIQASYVLALSTIQKTAICDTDTCDELFDHVRQALTTPDQSDTIKVLVEALQKISAGTVDTNIKDQKDMYLHAFMEQSEIAYEVLALAEKARGA